MINYIKQSFKRELLMCFLVVALVPLILSGMFLIRMFEMKLEQDNQRKDMVQATQIEKKLEELFAEFDRTALALAADVEIQENLKLAGENPRNQVYSHLYEETVQLREKGQVDLYTFEGICQYSTGMGMVRTTLPTYWGILKIATAHPGEFVIRREKTYGGDRETLLRAARSIEDQQGDIVGYVVVSMRTEHFSNILQGVYDRQDGICILNSFWETVYSDGLAYEENIGAILRRRLLDGEALEKKYNGNSIYISQLGETGLISVLVRPEIFTEAATQSMYSTILVMALASFFLCLVVAARMSNHLSWPIRVLNHAMHKLQEGDLNARITSERQDEFGQLSSSFNTMAKELKGYVEGQVSQQKKLNDVEIAMMQAQLNPHFLYNTLDTMKWVAKANHIPEIATLAAKLAKILRTSISKEQFIPLREELELVESYVEIQRIRFNGKFSYTCNSLNPLTECKVPKLIIQPLVENAVIHGLAESENGSIFVEVEGREGRLYISVEDDGCGISQEQIERINKRRWDELSGHIGLYNVDTIIRLHYGEDYGLQAEALEKGGTKMTIVLPINNLKEILA